MRLLENFVLVIGYISFPLEHNYNTRKKLFVYSVLKKIKQNIYSVESIVKLFSQHNSYVCFQYIHLAFFNILILKNSNFTLTLYM